MTNQEDRSEEELIRRAVANLHGGEVETYKKAIAEGGKDVLCPFSRKPILAHQHVFECGRKPCFYAMSEMNRQKVISKLCPAEPLENAFDLNFGNTKTES